MMKKTFTFRLWSILLLVIFAFFACEQEEIIQETKELSKEQFFLTNVRLSEYEKKIIQDVKYLIPDSVISNLKQYGNLNWKGRKFYSTNIHKNEVLFLTTSYEEESKGLFILQRISDSIHWNFYSKEILLKLDEGNPWRSIFLLMSPKISSRLNYKIVQEITTKSTSYVCYNVYGGPVGDLEYSYSFCIEHYVHNAPCIAPGETAGRGGGHSDFGGGDYGGGRGFLPNPAPEVDDKEIEGTKVGCVKEKLEKGGDASLVNQLLKGFKLEESKINVIYKTGEVGGRKGKGGKTVSKLQWNKKGGEEYVTGNLIVTIDLDKWMNRTSIGLAYSFLHETLQAYLLGQKWAKKFHKNAGDVETSFNDVWKEYKRIYGKEESQHQFMAENYIEPMKEAMKIYFEKQPYYDSFMNYVSDNTEWKGVDAMMEALVWRGLKRTEAWKNLPDEKQTEIDHLENLFLKEDLNKPENCEEK